MNKTTFSFFVGQHRLADYNPILLTSCLVRSFAIVIEQASKCTIKKNPSPESRFIYAHTNAGTGPIDKSIHTHARIARMAMNQLGIKWVGDWSQFIDRLIVHFLCGSRCTRLNSVFKNADIAHAGERRTKKN